MWLQVRLLKTKLEANSNTLAVIVDFIKPSKELKPYELRVIVSENKVSIARLEEELDNVKKIALQAINNVGSIIRHSKEQPITRETINKFIKEQGLLSDESPPKSD